MNISDIINEANAKTIFKPVISGGYGHYLTADDAAHIEFVDGNTSSVTVTVEPFKRYVVDSRENGNVTLNCSALDGRFYSAEVICNFAAAGQYKIIMTSFDKVEGYESKEIDKSGTYLIHIENWNGCKYAVVNKSDGNVMKSSFEPTLTGLNVTFGSGYIPNTYNFQNNDLFNGPLDVTVSSYSWDRTVQNGTQYKMAFDENEWVYGAYNPKMYVIAKHGTGAYAAMNGVWIATDPTAEFIIDYYHIVPEMRESESIFLGDLSGIEKMSSTTINNLVSSLYDLNDEEELIKFIKVVAFAGSAKLHSYTNSAFEKLLKEKGKDSDQERNKIISNVKKLIGTYGTVSSWYDSEDSKYKYDVSMINWSSHGERRTISADILHLKYGPIKQNDEISTTSSWYICLNEDDEMKFAYSDNINNVNASITGFNTLNLMTNDCVKGGLSAFANKVYWFDPDFEITGETSGNLSTDDGILPIFLFNSDISKISFDNSFEKCKVFTYDPIISGNYYYSGYSLGDYMTYDPVSTLWMTSDEKYKLSIWSYSSTSEYKGWQVAKKGSRSYSMQFQNNSPYPGAEQWPFDIIAETHEDFAWWTTSLTSKNKVIGNLWSRHIMIVPYDVSLKDPDSIVVGGFTNNSFNGTYEFNSTMINCRRCYQKNGTYLYCSIINNDRSWIFTTSTSYANCNDPESDANIIAFSDGDIKNGTLAFTSGGYGLNVSNISLQFNYN